MLNIFASLGELLDVEVHLFETEYINEQPFAITPTNNEIWITLEYAKFEYAYKGIPQSLLIENYLLSSDDFIYNDNTKWIKAKRLYNTHDILHAREYDIVIYDKVFTLTSIKVK